MSETPEIAEAAEETGGARSGISGPDPASLVLSAPSGIPSASSAFSSPALLTAGALGKVFTVSRTTIANYRKAGMPVAAEDDHKNPLYDVAACRAWVLVNREKTGHGGKRETLDAAGGDGGGLASGESTAAVLAGVDTSSPESIIAAMKSGKITQAVAKALVEVLKASSSRLQMDKSMGLLVSRDAAARVMGEHLQTVKAQLQGLHRRAGPKIAALLRITGESARAVEQIIEAEVERTCRALAENPVENMKAA